MLERNSFPMGFSSRSWLGLVLSLLLLTPGTLSGQVGASGLTGVITDPKGVPVAGATITARNEGTNIEWNVTAGNTGTYAVPSLPPGLYTVSAELSGFQKTVSEHVLL